MSAIAQGLVSVLINGVEARTVEFADRGLQYGDGVFTTLQILQGMPLFLSRHLARLQNDASRLNLPVPAMALLEQEARRLASSNPRSVLKIILTRGVGGRGYRPPDCGTGTRILSVYPLPDYPKALEEVGVKARFCELRLGLNPRLAGIKHLNRLEQILARAEWQDEDVREGLLLDYEGFLVEGVMSNLFLIQAGRLRTPLLDRCGVSGVMRGVVLEVASGLGLEVEEARLRAEDAFNADEMFLTNSVISIWPVSLLDNKAFPVGGITRLLSSQVESRITQELTLP